VRLVVRRRCQDHPRLGLRTDWFPARAWTLGGRRVLVGGLSCERGRRRVRAPVNESPHVSFPPLVLFHSCVPHPRAVRGPSRGPLSPVPSLFSGGGLALAGTAGDRSRRPGPRPRRPGPRPRRLGSTSRRPGPTPRCRRRVPRVGRRRLSTTLGSMVAPRVLARLRKVPLYKTWPDHSRRCATRPRGVSWRPPCSCACTGLSWVSCRRPLEDVSRAESLQKLVAMRPDLSTSWAREQRR